MYNTAVEKIDVVDGKVQGVFLKEKNLTVVDNAHFTQQKEEKSDSLNLPADIIISNADMHHTETKLLAPHYQSYPESYRAKKVISPS